jgi:hypothetical protein
MVGTGGICWQRQYASHFQVLLKLMQRAEPRDSHQIINEWGGPWVVLRPSLGNIHTHAIISHIFFMSPEFSLTIA